MARNSDCYSFICLDIIGIVEACMQCVCAQDFTQEEFKQFEEVFDRIIHAIGEVRSAA